MMMYTFRIDPAGSCRLSRSETLMSTRLRIQYPGAIYHVMRRGDHAERIFIDELDRTRFLGASQPTLGI